MWLLYHDHHIMQLFFLQRAKNLSYHTCLLHLLPISLYLIVHGQNSNKVIWNICSFSKSPRNFCRHTFLTLPAPWFDYCKNSHAYLVVVALATISKVISSRYWWMIVSAFWSFFRVFCTASCFHMSTLNFIICEMRTLKWEVYINHVK